MAIKAHLKMILTADEVVIAETEDPRLWQAALHWIQGGGSDPRLERCPVESGAAVDWAPEQERAAIRSLADDLGLAPADLLSACHPRMIPPYIFLNRRYWEAFKRQTAARGRTAISNVVLAATLLLLWSDKIHLDRITLRDGMAVLRTIAARDDHASRALGNCPWLQRSMGRITLRPEGMPRALAVARAFCTQTVPDWGEERQTASSRSDFPLAGTTPETGMGNLLVRKEVP